jgi:hypothetical protein
MQLPSRPAYNYEGTSINFAHNSIFHTGFFLQLGRILQKGNKAGKQLVQAKI